MGKKIRTRLYLPLTGTSYLQCNDPETLGIRKTLRLSEGENVSAFNGDGREYYYEIESSSRSGMGLRLLDSIPNPKDPQCDLVVCVAATKGKTRDRMAKDLPALGVTTIIFYQAERSIAKLENSQEDRLHKIAIEACRQCGRSTIPSIKILEESLLDLLAANYLNTEQCLVFWEGQREYSTDDYAGWSSFSTLLFGPEGGFSPEEIAEIKNQALATASLGDRILRTELAVVAGVVQFNFLEQYF